MLRSAPMRALIAAATLAGCRDSDVVAPPENLPPLASATWYVHVSDGQELPALIGHRSLPGNVLEQDFLDSTKFEISEAGTWVQNAWYKRFQALEFHSARTAQDFGTWTATPTGYEFRRHTGQLVYTLVGPVGGELRLNLRYPEMAGVAVSLLRPTPP